MEVTGAKLVTPKVMGELARMVTGAVSAALPIVMPAAESTVYIPD